MKDWYPPTKATFATYSNLPHGVYAFKVIAENAEGQWTPTPAIFNFEIKPAFWQTQWFVSLCVFLFILIVLLIYKWRLSVIKRKQHTQQLEYKSQLLSLEQKALNASMNRHFIFNALNSIQYYINSKDKLSANKYLTSFAKLIRKNLDSSQKNMIPLSEELERLQLYLQLEHMRFKNKFEYELLIDEAVDVDNIQVPTMLLQPYS